MDPRTTVTRLYGTQEWEQYQPAIDRWEGITARPAPTPTEPNANGNPRIRAEFSEWMMGWPQGWVTDLINPSRRKVEGTVSRTAAMQMIGNGVCTHQATVALRALLDIHRGEA